MTTRDEVWEAIVEELVREGEFKISELPIDEKQRQTVRRVCRKMEDMGFLTRESKQSKTWRAGEKSKALLNLSMRAQVTAGFDEQVS